MNLLLQSSPLTYAYSSLLKSLLSCYFFIFPTILFLIMSHQLTYISCLSQLWLWILYSFPSFQMLNKPISPLIFINLTFVLFFIRILLCIKLPPEGFFHGIQRMEGAAVYWRACPTSAQTTRFQTRLGQLKFEAGFPGFPFMESNGKSSWLSCGIKWPSTQVVRNRRWTNCRSRILVFIHWIISYPMRPHYRLHFLKPHFRVPK